MKKTLYIIPGYTESSSNEPYKHIAHFFTQKGYAVHILSINWKYRTMSDYINVAKTQIRSDCSSVSILGFSFGAFIAASLATTCTVETLYLCSLSPYYSEIIPIVPTSWQKALGTKRMRDFQKYSLVEIAKHTKATVHFFQGETELVSWPSMVQCKNIAQSNYKNFMRRNA